MINGKPNPHHELFGRWCAMRHNCRSEKSSNYRFYGARGIDYPDKWNDFETFVLDVESTIGPLPYVGAHFDRKNNDKSYSKRNICWSTPKENGNNRRTNHLVTYRGKTQSMAEWSRETGIPFKTLWSRLADHGMTPKDAFRK
jgi:hypothetical protein